MFRFFSKIKNSMISFMYGRYGTDNLYNFLNVCVLILMLIELFGGSYLLTLLCLGLIIYSTFRVFSKNIVKRQAENRRYLLIKNKIKRFFTGDSALRKAKKRDKKTHVFIKCPSCKNTLRLKRIKGRHSVSCPCCHKSFEVKI